MARPSSAPAFARASAAAGDLRPRGRLHRSRIGLVERGRLDAVAVRCFDLVTRRGTSGCLALSALNDAGRVAASEGDLASAAGMLWVRELLGGASWMANPSRVDPAPRLLRLARCTVARSLVTSWERRSQFESGSASPSRATWPRARSRSCASKGEASTGSSSSRERPLGNHLVLVPGRHGARLRTYWELAVAGPARGEGPG